MRDPRNWVRPAVAIVAGGAAGSALVLLRARHRARAAAEREKALMRAYGSFGASLQRSAQRALEELSERTRRLRESD
jgi:type II secretory pathway component PulJ